MARVNKLVAREIGDVGRMHLRKSADETGRLGRLLLETRNLSRWPVRAIVPAELSEDELGDVEKGSVFGESCPPYELSWESSSVRVTSRTSALAAIINFLGDRAEGSAWTVMQNWVAEPSDPWLDSYEGQVVFSRNEVYHFVQLPANLDDIEREIRHSKTLPFYLGVVCSTTDETVQLEDRGHFDEHVLEVLADGTIMAFTTVYDAESYLIAFPPSVSDQSQLSAPV